MRVARWAPALVAVAASVAIFGASAGCGKSIFSEATASSSRTATATSTSTPATAFLFASNFNDAQIAEFKRDRSTGALSLVGDVSAGQTGGPMGLAITPNDKFLYLANQADGNIYEFAIQSNGTLAKISPGAIAAGSAPQIVAVDPTGSWAYVTNLGSGSISEYSIDSSSGALSSIGNFTGLTGPFGIIAHPGGSFVYVADNKGGAIWSFAINSDGTLSSLGAPLPSLGTSAGSPGLMTIAMDSSANVFLFVDDVAVGLVSEFTIASNGTLAFGAVFGLANSGKPIGIGLATNSGTNYLYTANSVGNSVSFFSRFGPSLSLLNALGGLNAPTGLGAAPQENFVYTGDSGDGTVAQLQINGSCGSPLCFVKTFATESPPNTRAGTQFVATTN